MKINLLMIKLLADAWNFSLSLINILAVSLQFKFAHWLNSYKYKSEM